MNYKIQELSTQKFLIVHYHRIKPYHVQTPRPTSIPERQPVTKKVPTPSRSRPINQDHCVVTFLPPPVSLSVQPTRPTPSSTYRSLPSSPAASMFSHLFPTTPLGIPPIHSMPPPSRQSQRYPPTNFSYEPTPVPFSDEQPRLREFTPSSRLSFVPSPVEIIIQKRLQAILKTLTKLYLAFPRVLFGQAQVNNTKGIHSTKLRYPAISRTF